MRGRTVCGPACPPAASVRAGVGRARRHRGRAGAHRLGHDPNAADALARVERVAEVPGRPALGAPRRAAGPLRHRVVGAADERREGTHAVGDRRSRRRPARPRSTRPRLRRQGPAEPSSGTPRGRGARARRGTRGRCRALHRAWRHAAARAASGSADPAQASRSGRVQASCSASQALACFTTAPPSRVSRRTRRAARSPRSSR